MIARSLIRRALAILESSEVAELTLELGEALDADDEARFRRALEEHVDGPASAPSSHDQLALVTRLLASLSHVRTFDAGRMRGRGVERGLGEPTELRLTPHLDVTPAPPLRPGQEFEAVVYLDGRLPQPGETTEDFVTTLPPNAEPLVVDVWLRGTSHFVIEAPLGRLTILPADKTSTPARFAVRVADPVPDVGDPGLSASFACRLRSSGLVERAVDLALQDGLLHATAAATQLGTGARIDLDAEPPQIHIEIHRKDYRDDLFDVTVRAAGHDAVGVWALDGTTDAWVQATMQHFFANRAGTRARVKSLEGAGIEFFARSPECFQQVYWDLVDAKRPPASISIVSEERSVPWELMVPRRTRKDGELEQHDPLGTRCAIGRWHRSLSITPNQHIPLRDSLVLAPRYARPLAMAEEEVAEVQSHFPGARLPATWNELDEYLDRHEASLIHFICHGKDETIQTIVLENREELTALQVAPSGLGRACRESRPFVFLNACDVGQPARGLAGIDGFPVKFIQENASAVVACLWAVDSAEAHEVAKDFYGALALDPARPFAEILRELRLKAYGANGKDTYAAYVFYGDPGAAMQR